MSDTQNVEAVRVGKRSVELGYKVIVGMVVGFFAILGGVIDVAMDVGAIRQEMAVVRELQGQVNDLRDSVAQVEIKLAVLAERLDAGLPAGR